MELWSGRAAISLLPFCVVMVVVVVVRVVWVVGCGCRGKRFLWIYRTWRSLRHGGGGRSCCCWREGGFVVVNFFLLRSECLCKVESSDRI
jgi:hypothetical protein